MENEKKYTVIKMKQREGSEEYYVGSINSRDILEWADVPRKKATILAGYQRELIKKRHEKITEYLNLSEENILIGAILISIDDTVEKKDLGNGLFELTISTVDTETIDTKLVKSYASVLYDRLSSEEQEYVDSGRIDPELSEVIEYEEIAEEIESKITPQSYLSQLTLELMNFETLNRERQLDIYDFIASMSKPGWILDGQHRVYGAKNANEQINLPVIFLPEMDVQEQVFNFYVLNKKAKPLNPTELRAVIGTSLSNKEIQSLWNRLEQTGISVDETGWTHKAHTTEESPFYGLVRFGFVDENNAFIPENVLYRVMHAFMRPNKKYNKMFQDIKEWEKDDYRMKLFFLFWKFISTKYSTSWKKSILGENRQIHMKVAMIVLQEFLMDELLNDYKMIERYKLPKPFEDTEALETSILDVLQSLPEDFFLLEWKQKSLDTSGGKSFLRSQMEDIKRKEGKYLTSHSLFKD